MASGSENVYHIYTWWFGVIHTREEFAAHLSFLDKERIEEDATGFPKRAGSRRVLELFFVHFPGHLCVWRLGELYMINTRVDALERNSIKRIIIQALPAIPPGRSCVGAPVLGAPI